MILKRARALLVTLSMFASMLAGSAISAVARPAGDLQWGVNGHPLVSYPGVTMEQQLDYVRDLGMRSYRVDIGRIEQAPALARLIETAKARGIEILPVLTPALDLDADTAEDLYAKSRALAHDLAARFRHDIRVWELGNELENYAIIKPCEMQDDGVQYNCSYGLAGGVGPLEYYGPRWSKVSAVLKGLTEGVATADPNIRRAVGTAGWGHVGAFKRMQQDGIRWEISVWHLYGDDPEWAFKVLREFNRPIWVTEFNNPRGGEAGDDREAQGLVFAATRLRQLRRAYGVEAAHVYELMDETYWAPDFEAVMGLVRLEKDGDGWKAGDLKPAYRSIKQLIAHPPPAVVEKDCNFNPYNRLNSPRSMQLSYAYCLVLSRAIDGQGFKDWMSALGSGKSIKDVLLSLLQSDEFRALRGSSAENAREYVTALYRTLLEREPDGAGLADYASQMEHGSLTAAQVAEGILQSQEFRSKHPILAWEKVPE